MEKRKWVYLQPPIEYGIPGHGCGHKFPDWSEFKEHLWCPQCKVDFVPEHWGILDGPVGINVCKMLGINFDRFNLETQQIERFTDKGTYE